MPKKGKTLLHGKREPFFGKAFIKRLREEHPELEFTDAQLKDICDSANLKIAESVYKDPTGFRLPFNLGILAITKYKSKKTIIDRASSAKYKKAIPYLNLHSFGYMFVIRHFKYTESRNQTRTHVYKFTPERKFKRNLAKIIKETGGEIYQNFNNQSFLTKSKLTHLFTTTEK